MISCDSLILERVVASRKTFQMILPLRLLMLASNVEVFCLQIRSLNFRCFILEQKVVPQGGPWIASFKKRVLPFKRCWNSTGRVLMGRLKSSNKVTLALLQLPALLWGDTCNIITVEVSSIGRKISITSPVLKFRKSRTGFGIGLE